MLGGFAPKLEIVQNPAMLFVAIGILGATVMPHNLYLHSSIVQTRKYEQSEDGKREAASPAKQSGHVRSRAAILSANRDRHANLVALQTLC